MKYSYLSSIFMMFVLLGSTHSIPDPLTTVHIQNYHGPVYYPSGCGCPYHTDDQIFFDTPSTVDNTSAGVTSVATATSEVSSQSGATAEASVVTGTSSRGATSSTATAAASGPSATPVVTITAYGKTDEECCCVNRHQPDYILINGATQCSSNSGSNYPSYSNPGPYYKNPEVYYSCPDGSDNNNYRSGNTNCRSNCDGTYNSNVGTSYTDQRPRTYDIPRKSYGLIHNKPESNYGRTYNNESPRIDFNCIGRDVDRAGANYYFEGSVEGYPVKDTAVLGYGIVKKNYNGCQCGFQNKK